MVYIDSRTEVVTADKIEEYGTPTTLHTVFVLPSLSRKPKYGDISIKLPLPNLGWSFALSLTPLAWTESHKKVVKKGGKITSSSTETHQWNPVAFTFQQHGRAIPWGNTSLRAQVSLTTESAPIDGDTLATDDTPACASNGPPPPSNDPELFGTLEKIGLARSRSLEIKLAPGTLSLVSPSKVELALTISDCPFSKGLFYVPSNSTEEADAQKWLAKRTGDRLLSRSLTTGRVYDVRFLTHSTPGNNDKLLETYAWLSVLEGHVDASPALLSEAWASALAALTHELGVKPVLTIPCPEGYEYELDSDFDEEEADESFGSFPLNERDSATLQGLDSKTEELGNPLSSLERDRASDLSSLDSLPEEIINDLEVPSYLSSKTTTNYERTITIEFAAHRTWHAFLWYCYTGHIEFCELKSQLEHGVRRLRVVGDDSPICSPKSMYRLADLVGDKNLKALALKAIKERMSKENVLEELFSIFTSKYPDVRETQLDVLIEHRTSSEVKKAFLEKIASKSGVLPHAESAIEAFYDRFAAMPAPPVTPRYAAL